MSISSDGIQSNRRKRVSKACDSCRLKKIKCDGQYPCSRCISGNKLCVFTEEQKPKKESLSYPELLESRVDILTKSLLKLVTLAEPHLPFLQKFMEGSNFKHQQQLPSDPDVSSLAATSFPINEIVKYLVSDFDTLSNELDSIGHKGKLISEEIVNLRVSKPSKSHLKKNEPMDEIKFSADAKVGSSTEASGMIELSSKPQKKGTLVSGKSGLDYKPKSKKRQDSSRRRKNSIQQRKDSDKEILSGDERNRQPSTQNPSSHELLNLPPERKRLRSSKTSFEMPSGRSKPITLIPMKDTGILPGSFSSDTVKFHRHYSKEISRNTTLHLDESHIPSTLSNPNNTQNDQNYLPQETFPIHRQQAPIVWPNFESNTHPFLFNPQTGLFNDPTPPQFNYNLENARLFQEYREEGVDGEMPLHFDREDPTLHPFRG